jgi:hypothetical protein
MKRIIALIYQSYVARKLYTPYIKALMTLIGGVLIILAIFFGLLNISFLNPFTISNKGGINLLVGGLFVCLMLIVFSSVYRRRDLARYHFTQRQLRQVTIYITVYFLTLILLLLITLILRAKHML